MARLTAAAGTGFVDPKEAPDLAKNKQRNMLASMNNKRVSPDDWRFFTGNAENIREITEAVGFRYVADPNTVDFIHAATVIFLSQNGKIVRYLNGTRFNPADLKLAVLDASEGRARSFMQRIQKLCYSYDPKGRAYVLKVNRIILGATLLFATVFGAFLLFKGMGNKSSCENPFSHAIKPGPVAANGPEKRIPGKVS